MTLLIIYILNVDIIVGLLLMYKGGIIRGVLILIGETCNGRIQIRLIGRVLIGCLKAVDGVQIANVHHLRHLIEIYGLSHGRLVRLHLIIRYAII